ncbi:hypothetical protein CDAR_599161 [Caerostris darwini]|uniref:Uncharacterized protein n=1 Tax=Caerostris darwini TaxID=1538125 RepID=A0AAV4R7N5_9ARAC|nr:hypothetical protein CDAR_599161 [Caerostris darwini]
MYATTKRSQQNHQRLILLLGQRMTKRGWRPQRVRPGRRKSIHLPLGNSLQVPYLGARPINHLPSDSAGVRAGGGGRRPSQQQMLDHPRSLFGKEGTCDRKIRLDGREGMEWVCV